MTTLDLTGKLAGGHCVLRIKTNMECYYDQAFIAVRDRQAERSLGVTTLPVARAVLSHRGYIREVSPDGRQPLIYDYDYVDPAPLARMSGKLTRYGDVACLLQSDDDRFCVAGPGDEVRLEFDAPACRRCQPAGHVPTSCARSAIARMPTRSRRPATRSSPCPGAGCRLFRSLPAFASLPINPTKTISAISRRGRRVMESRADRVVPEHHQPAFLRESRVTW